MIIISFRKAALELEKYDHNVLLNYLYQKILYVTFKQNQVNESLYFDNLNKDVS